MNLKWDKIYSVNINKLDEQHKTIFSIINKISELKNDFSNNDIKNLIKELQDYGVYHFQSEEEYFEKFNFPEAKFHISQHDIYRKKINKIAESINDERNNINEIITFLRNWWINHIQNIDHEYSEFLNQKGVY